MRYYEGTVKIYFLEKSKVEIDFIHNSISLNLKFRTEAKGEPKLQSSIPAVAIQNTAATKPTRNGSNIDWRTFGLNKHNEYRKQHHSPPLVLDPKVTTSIIIDTRQKSALRAPPRCAQMECPILWVLY